MLAKGLWLSFLWILNRDLGPLHHLTLCLDANSRLSSEQSTDVLTLLPSQKLHHLFDIWMVTQGCFPWALSWGSCPFTAALHFLLFKILTFVSYLIQYFHQTLKFLVHCLFRKPCRLLLSLFLEVAINLTFQLLSLVILFVSSVRSTSL